MRLFHYELGAGEETDSGYSLAENKQPVACSSYTKYKMAMYTNLFPNFSHITSLMKHFSFRILSIFHLSCPALGWQRWKPIHRMISGWSLMVLQQDMFFLLSGLWQSGCRRNCRGSLADRKWKPSLTLTEHESIILKPIKMWSLWRKKVWSSDDVGNKNKLVYRCVPPS